MTNDWLTAFTGILTRPLPLAALGSNKAASGQSSTSAPPPAYRPRNIRCSGPPRFSKIVTARTLQALVKQDKLSLDFHIADLLGVPFQHPTYPATPLTLRMLLRRRA